MNDTGSKWCGLIFVIRGDGKELWQSKPLSAGDPKEHCDLDVSGVSVLTLEVRMVGTERGVDRTAWLTRWRRTASEAGW